MESHAKYILVGAFVFVSAILLVVALLWLSGAGGSRNVDFYTVYFRRQSLEGLQQDGDVTMKGIKIGSIDDYKISTKSVEEVIVTLRVDRDTPVKVDTRAVIKRNLLTGLAHVDLIGSSQESERLREILPAERYPVLPEGTSEMDRIAESIPALLEQVNNLSSRVEGFLSPANVESFTTMLNNLRDISEIFSGNKERLANTLVYLEDATRAMKTTGESLNSFAKNADKAVQHLDKYSGNVSTSVVGASQVFSQEMIALSQSLRQAAESFAKTVEDFQDPRTIITGPRATSMGPGEAVIR